MNDTPNTQPTPPSRDPYALRKKIIKITLIVSAVIILLYLITLVLEPLVDGWFEPEPDDSGGLKIEFYPVDEDLNILIDDEYEELDRRVTYYDPDSGATYWLEPEEVDVADPAIQFFYYYFEAVVMGDDDTYATMFTDAYKKANELPTDFPMQMIYDIRIEPYAAMDAPAGTYVVEYKIHKNTGTFRDDMGSDVSRAQLFYLTSDGDGYLIDNIRIFTSY